MKLRASSGCERLSRSPSQIASAIPWAQRTPQARRTLEPWRRQALQPQSRTRSPARKGRSRLLSSTTVSSASHAHSDAARGPSWVLAAWRRRRAGRPATARASGAPPGELGSPAAHARRSARPRHRSPALPRSGANGEMRCERPQPSCPGRSDNPVHVPPARRQIAWNSLDHGHGRVRETEACTLYPHPAALPTESSGAPASPSGLGDRTASSGLDGRFLERATPLALPPPSPVPPPAPSPRNLHVRITPPLLKGRAGKRALPFRLLDQGHPGRDSSGLPNLRPCPGGARPCRPRSLALRSGFPWGVR
jgi:hypothetical protein